MANGVASVLTVPSQYIPCLVLSPPPSHQSRNRSKHLLIALQSLSLPFIKKGSKSPTRSLHAPLTTIQNPLPYHTKCHRPKISFSPSSSLPHSLFPPQHQCHTTSPPNPSKIITTFTAGAAPTKIPVSDSSAHRAHKARWRLNNEGWKVVSLLNTKERRFSGFCRRDPH